MPRNIAVTFLSNLIARHPDYFRAFRVLALLCLVGYLPAIIGVCSGNYPFAGDAISQAGPWREFTWQCIKQGIVPLWNPHHFCGQPFVGNGQSAIFYPPNIVYLLPIPIALLTDALFHNMLLMFGSYVLARALGMTDLAAKCVAICIGLGGAVGGHINDGHMTWHAVRSYIPWELWTLLTYLRTGRRRYALLLPVLFTLQIGAGYPPIVLLGFGLCCGLAFAWVTSRIVRRWRGELVEHIVPLGWAPVVAGIAILTATLAAISILPLMEVSRLSVHVGRMTYEEATHLSGTWRSLVRLFYPDLFGGNGGSAWSIFFEPHEEAAYIGLIALILALGAPWWARRPGAPKPPRAVWWLWSLLPVVAILALGHNTPIYKWLFDNVAILRIVRLPVRWLELFYLLSALLAGFALDGWIGRTRSLQQKQLTDAKLARDKSLVTLPVVLGIFAIASLLCGLLFLQISPREPLWMEYAQWNANRSPAERLRTAIELQGKAVMALMTAFVIAAAGVVLCRKLLLPESRAGERKRIELALLGLIGLDVLMSFCIAAKPYRNIQIQTLITWPSQLTQLYRPEQRWSTQGSGGSVNAGITRGIDLFNGYDPMSGWRYFQFVNKIGKERWRENFQVAQHAPLVRVAGVSHVLKYQFDKERQPVEAGRFLARSGNFELWQLPGAWPRAYLSRRVVQVPAGHQLELLKRLAGQPFMAKNAPVVVAPGKFAGIGSRPLQNGERVAQWRHDTNTVSVSTVASEPSVLMLGEAWAPGWRARVAPVSGQYEPAPLEVGNFMFRSLQIPAGQARIHMAYDSSTFRCALFISLCALSLLMAIVAAQLNTRPRTAPGAPERRAGG